MFLDIAICTFRCPRTGTFNLFMSSLPRYLISPLRYTSFLFSGRYLVYFKTSFGYVSWASLSQGGIWRGGGTFVAIPIGI